MDHISPCFLRLPRVPPLPPELGLRASRGNMRPKDMPLYAQSLHKQELLPLFPLPTFQASKIFPFLQALSVSAVTPPPPHPLQGSSLVLSECRRTNAEGQGHGPQPDQSLPGGKKMRSVPWVGERIHQRTAAEKDPALTVLLFPLHQAIQNEKF